MVVKLTNLSKNTEFLSLLKANFMNRTTPIFPHITTFAYTLLFYILQNTISMKRIISTADAPAAIGPYSQAVESNGFLFTSGQIPIDPATGQIVEGDITAQTQQVFKNIRAILQAAGYTMDHILKTTVFLADMNDFAAMNEVYAQQFEGSFPSRSAVAVKTLPMNVLVEIETICAK